ncbi:hypothetical protein AGMMS49938_02010 [Fibrobacterales bacterium]|nr:hypothetical protein AGMMS49938_02010 [Fibrobacterales bacterium]
MLKRLCFSIIASVLVIAPDLYAQRAAQEDDRAARRQWEEDQRADEYANSLRRRDWLKDRLLLEIGAGTKYSAMGENWFGFGAGVEYITRWHVSAFATGGLIPAHDDPAFSEYSLDGGISYRFGLAYYLFPKSPIHLSVQASYGTVFYDHKAEPTADNVREIITCNGYEFDLAVSYLSDEWYYLQAIVGIYTIGNGLKDGGNSMGRTNDSWVENDKGELVSIVPTKSDNANEAIPPWGVVFGVGVGFAFEEFFPDDTELRRREREDTRKPTVRNTSSSTSKPSSAKKRRVVEEYDDE